MGRWTFLLLLVVACGERPPATPRDAAAPASESMAAAPAPPAPPLPPLDAARLQELAGRDVAGFTVTARDRTEASLVVALTAPPLRALVTIGPCLRCLAADDLPAWRALEPELRALLPGGLEEDPSTRFELDGIDVAGRRCVRAWHLGAAAYGDEHEAAHGTAVYCNDGVTEVVVRVDDDSVHTAASPDEARAAAQRHVVDDAASRVVEVFLR